MTLPKIRNATVKITKVTEKDINSFWWLLANWAGIALKMVELLIWDKDNLLFSPVALNVLTAVFMCGFIFRE